MWDQTLRNVSSPVIGAGRALSHSGISVLWYEPVKVLVCNQANKLPVLLSKVTTVGVEVAKKHHVLHTMTTLKVRLQHVN